jgi:hypothetical protein
MPFARPELVIRILDRERRRCLIAFASVISTRQPADDLAQCWFTDLFHRTRGRDPLDDPLLFFGPLFALAPDLQRKHVHVTDDDLSILQALFIGERANGALGNCTENASFLERFARGRILRRLALLRPALRDDPASGFGDVMSMNCGRREPARNR